MRRNKYFSAKFESRLKLSTWNQLSPAFKSCITYLCIEMIFIHFSKASCALKSF